MKVVLVQNVSGLGKADEVKEVADGYARNFLFAKNLAVPATSKILSDLAARQAKKTKNAEQDLRDQQATAEKLDGREVFVKEKASESGALYAAVGPQKISEALKKMGFAVNKNKIILKPIKEAGEYKAKIKLGHGLEAEITIVVNLV
ncbi:50S ribosomal protein L9 [Patescibacteria group bacterium]|nr:MAG: 50S ribosomal protein L9 [Patescibacteria group bacterium]